MHVCRNQLCSLFLLFSCSVMSDSLRSRGLQHARLPCPSPSPGVCSDSCPLSQQYHPTVSSSVASFSFISTQMWMKESRKTYIWASALSWDWRMWILTDGWQEQVFWWWSIYQTEERVSAKSRNHKTAWNFTPFQDGLTDTRFTLPPGPTNKTRENI